MKLRKTLYIFGTFLIFIIPGIYYGELAIIKHQANSYANEAVLAFHQDKTKSLLMLIDSENYSFQQKNKAVWTLGVLKDEKALPKLEMLYTGKECNHDSALCQYEIKKAILKIKGEFSGSWQAKNNTTD